MFDPKIKLSKSLYQKVKAASDSMGCATVDEWVEGVLEEAAAQALAESSGSDQISAAEVDDITKKLEGLGYLK